VAEVGSVRSELSSFRVCRRAWAIIIIRLSVTQAQTRLTLGQDQIKETKHVNRSIVASSVAACICLGLAIPSFAAETGTPNLPPTSEKATGGIKPAEKCLTDLRAFDSHMRKDGYWLGGSGTGTAIP
jgi:hypothetical protein